MATEELKYQIEGLFFEISPEQGAAEKTDGSLFKEVVTGILEGEARYPAPQRQQRQRKRVAHSSLEVKAVTVAEPAIERQIAARRSVRQALVLVILIVVILAGIGIPLLFSSNLVAPF